MKSRFYHNLKSFIDSDLEQSPSLRSQPPDELQSCGTRGGMERRGSFSHLEKSKLVNQCLSSFLGVALVFV